MPGSRDKTDTWDLHPSVIYWARCFGDGSMILIFRLWVATINTNYAILSLTNRFHMQM